MGLLLEIPRRKELALSGKCSSLARDFWDTQLRKEESCAEKWLYVVENPVRAGLVTRSSDWPYQGEMHSLNW